MSSVDKAITISIVAICFAFSACGASCAWVEVAKQQRLGGCK